MSAAEVHDLFAPNESSIEAVKAWLIESGVSADKLLAYENKGWIGADVSIKDAERLFRTQYHEHENSKGEIRLGCDQYHVPAHLSDHIDYISPGVKLSPPMKKRSIAKRSGEGWGPPGWGGSGNGNPWGHGPVRIPSWWPQGPWHNQQPPSSGSLPADLQGCALNFTVACYRAIYNIPDAHEKGWNVSSNSLGLYEDGDIYSQTDLNLYFAKYTPYVPQGVSLAIALDNSFTNRFLRLLRSPSSSMELKLRLLLDRLTTPASPMLTLASRSRWSIRRR